MANTSTLHKTFDYLNILVCCASNYTSMRKLVTPTSNRAVVKYRKWMVEPYLTSANLPEGWAARSKKPLQ